MLVVFMSVTAQFGVTAVHASANDAKSLVDEVFESSFAEGDAGQAAQSAAAKEVATAGLSVSAPSKPKPVVAQAASPAGTGPSTDEVKRAVRSGGKKAHAADEADDQPEQSSPTPSSSSATSYAGARRVSSTAYCLTGTMASGRRVYWGAAAMNGTPLGSRYQVLDGPRAGETLTVEDRIGHGSAFDIAYPGDCRGATNYGRRTISIRPV